MYTPCQVVGSCPHTLPLQACRGLLQSCAALSLAQATSFAGAVVNVLRLPERLFHDAAAEEKGVRVAGRFDYWLNSHQLMHVAVTASMLHLHLGARADYMHFYGQNRCPWPPEP